MFNEATNSWEETSYGEAWAAAELSVPCSWNGDGGKAMEGEVLHFPLLETET